MYFARVLQPQILTSFTTDRNSTAMTCVPFRNVPFSQSARFCKIYASCAAPSTHAPDPHRSLHAYLYSWFSTTISSSPAIHHRIPHLLDTLWESVLKAVPKKKTSHSKKRSRFLAGKASQDVTALNKCSSCGSIKRAHLLCPFCVDGSSTSSNCSVSVTNSQKDIQSSWRNGPDLVELREKPKSKAT